VLQSPPIGEWSEPFGTKQVGFVGEPFSATPSRGEIDSLAAICTDAARCLG